MKKSLLSPVEKSNIVSLRNLFDFDDKTLADGSPSHKREDDEIKATIQGYLAQFDLSITGDNFEGENNIIILSLGELETALEEKSFFQALKIILKQDNVLEKTKILSALVDVLKTEQMITCIGIFNESSEEIIKLFYITLNNLIQTKTLSKEKHLQLMKCIKESSINKAFLECVAEI